MIEANLIGGLIGGLLIGIAASLLLALNGRIAGISGILGGLILPHAPGSERSWRILFLIGLVAGAAIYVAISGGLAVEIVRTPIGLMIAGFFVGVGTRLGSGCTSGHGVCGIGRRSPRSLAATATFIASGVVTVLVLRQLGL